MNDAPAAIAPSRLTARQRYWLWGLLAAALLLRIGTVVTLESKPLFYEPQVDAAAYDVWAQDIATRSALGNEAFYMDPLYAYLLGAYYAAFGRDLYHVRFVQAVIGTSGCLALFLAARRLLGTRAGFAALVLAGGYETSVFYDTALTKDFLGTALMSWAILALTVATGARRPTPWLATGVLMGLLALVRGNALLLVGAVTAALLVTRRRAALAPAAALLVGTALAIAPATLRNAWVAHDFVLTTAQLGPNLYTGNHPGNETGRYEWPAFITSPSPADEGPGFRKEAARRAGRALSASEVDRFWLREAFAYIAANPATFLRTTGKRLAVLFNRFEIPDSYSLYQMEEFSWVLRLPLATFGWVVGPLGLLGVVLGVGDRRLRWLYVLLGTYVASIAVFFVFDRYRLPMIPPLVVFSAFAIDAFVTRARRHDARALAMPVAVLALAVVFVQLPIERIMNVGNFDSAAAHYNLARLQLLHQRCDLALPELQRVITERPQLGDSYGLHEMIGRCQTQVGDAAGAAASFARAAALRQTKGAPPAVPR